MRAPPLDSQMTVGMLPDAASARTICLTRVSLAVFAIVLALVPAPQVTQWTSAALALLVFYCIYSVLLFRLAHGNEVQRVARFYHWADAALCVALLAVHHEGNALYLVFLGFPIFTASYGWGFAEGLRVTLASVAVWLTINHLGDTSNDHSELWSHSREVLGLVLGVMISHWVSFEEKQKAGLVFLRAISQTPNPRFGRDELVGAYLERLCDFYRADTCMAVVTEANRSPRLIVAEHAKSSAPLTGASASSLAATLMSLPDDCAVAFGPRTSLLARFMRSNVIACEAANSQQALAVQKQGEQLAEYLDAGSWMSVPLKARGVAAGRLYVMSQKARFDETDLQLLRQVADQMMPTIETVALLDEFASDAAGRERRTISLDLHDSTIQPYLGLKLGLESLRRKVAPDNPLAIELDELCAMTNESIADLRRYIGGLKDERGKGAASLMEGIHRQLEKFGKLYGIEAEVNATSDFRLNDRLTAELLQIVGEGLSNIGRHTQSRWAQVNLCRRGSHLVLQIINNGAQLDQDRRSFVPKSITQRAAQLGGSVEVSPQPRGGSAVTVDIPL